MFICCVYLLSEISSVILGVSMPNLQRILQAMAKSERWEELKALVDKAKEAGKPLGTFASSISVREVIRAKGLQCPKKEASFFTDLHVHKAQICVMINVRWLSVARTVWLVFPCAPVR